MASAMPGPVPHLLAQPHLAPAPARDRPFFGRVESLRGLGALAVAAYHMSGAMLHGVRLFPHGAWDGAGTSQNALGRFALVLLPAHAALMVFFVISGFVLRVSLQHGPQKVSLASGKFLLARLFRIYPIVIVGVILTVILFGGEPYPPRQVAEPLTAPHLLANMFLLDISVNGSFWALQVELLMMPVILLLYFLERSRGPRILLCIALATTALAYWTRWAVWPPLSTNVFPFVLGMLVPTLGRRFATGLSRRAATFWTLGVVLAMLLTAPCLGVFSRQSAVIEAYSAAVLVSMVAYRQDLGLLKWLDARPLRLLGMSSGSYYVLHMATLPVTLAIAGAIIPPSWSASIPALVGFFVIPTWLVAIAPLTLGSFYLIEAPAIALGRRVARLCRLDSRPVPSAGSQQGEQRQAA
jgi:peptidoglycan/LPS O-acetylase OafA/YrhL